MVVSAEPTGTGRHGRVLEHYPDNRHRIGYLVITALATVVLYYQSFAAGTVATHVITSYQMSFVFYVNITVVGFLLGAATAVAASLADRWGRVNLIVIGLLVVGVLVAFVQPHTTDKWAYGAVSVVIGLVEGVVLVATPALIRDFSPQFGRGAAMALWTLGPVLGALTASAVSSATLDHLADWRSQFTIAGIVGLAMAVVAFVGLRELSPQLRQQLMVSLRDRELIEARARGIDVQAGLAHPWRQVLTPRIIGASVAISVFLLFFYAVIGFLVLYLALSFGYPASRANALANWFWAGMAVSLVVVGALSDRLRVRKPFMLGGAIGGIATSSVFAVLATRSETGFGTLAAVLAGTAVFIGMAYVPWMAGFTETVEARNPALIATGLAVWGGVLRLVSAAFLFCVPLIVTSVTPLIDHGPHFAELVAHYPEEVATARAIEPDTLTALIANQKDFAAIGAASQQVAAALDVSPLAALQRLSALSDVPPTDLEYLYTYGPEVLQAQQDNPAQWQRMWWVTVLGMVAFIPLIGTVVGEWRPSRARAKAKAHDELVAAELAQLEQAKAR